jgi:uncharacterized protein
MFEIMSERERQPSRGEWRVSVGDAETSAVYEAATDGEQRAVFVCAHGAGGNMNDRSVLSTANAMRARGFGVVRFNFLYKEKKSGRPDPMPKLKDCYNAVLQRVREELRPPTLVIGGRSMGGRTASMLAADGVACDGLLLLAYPLHPPGKPEQVRDAHLPAIKVPVICFNGTRDPFCTPSLMDRVVERLGPNWEMHWVEGADHSFHVLKSSGKTDSQVMNDIAADAHAWLRKIKGD